jgi:hypothetical protein
MKRDVCLRVDGVGPAELSTLQVLSELLVKHPSAGIRRGGV